MESDLERVNNFNPIENRAPESEQVKLFILQETVHVGLNNLGVELGIIMKFHALSELKRPLSRIFVRLKFHGQCRSDTALLTELHEAVSNILKNSDAMTVYRVTRVRVRGSWAYPHTSR